MAGGHPRLGTVNPGAARGVYLFGAIGLRARAGYLLFTPLRVYDSGGEAKRS
jgi:hypothetical protein